MLCNGSIAPGKPWTASGTGMLPTIQIRFDDVTAEVEAVRQDLYTKEQKRPPGGH